MLIFFFVVNSGAFEDPEIIHVDDIVDPVRDLETITEELRLKVFYVVNFLTLILVPQVVVFLQNINVKEICKPPLGHAINAVILLI